MTELIELHPLKTAKSRRSYKNSYTLTTVQSSSDSSEDESSSNDESPIVLQLPSKSSKSSKSSKRNNIIQTLPVIINAQPTKQKKKHHRKQVQQFVINSQPPPSPKKKEIVINPIIEHPFSPAIQYVPISASTAIVERNPFAYRSVYTPTLVEERPFGFYSSYESPVRRIVRTRPPNTRSVHLPKHAKKLVNRFLSGMEYAHGGRVSERI
jgi:hypothetical protein